MVWPRIRHSSYDGATGGSDESAGITPVKQPEITMQAHGLLMYKNKTFFFFFSFLTKQLHQELFQSTRTARTIQPSKIPLLFVAHAKNYSRANQSSNRAFSAATLSRPSPRSSSPISSPRSPQPSSMSSPSWSRSESSLSLSSSYSSFMS